MIIIRKVNCSYMYIQVNNDCKHPYLLTYLQVQYTCISQSTLMSSSDLLFCLLDCSVHKLCGYYCK